MESNYSQRRAKELREEAARFDRLAKAARQDGDLWDAARCENEASECRRKARDYEVT